MTTSHYSGTWDNTAAALEMYGAFQTAAATFLRYTNAYTIPFIIAANYFNQVEKRRFWGRTPEENLLSYLELSNLNMKLVGSALKGDMQAVDQFLAMEFQTLLSALTECKSGALTEFASRMQRLSKLVAYAYPAAIEGVEHEFGFHFERQPPSSLIDETDRFLLYQVLPTEPGVSPRENGKPVLIIPPFVLGANILAFLPMEKRSFAHAFANQGFPTFIRISKNIQTSEAVQLMTPEDDAKDTRRFCQVIKNKHGIPVTLNGYCQGGYTALCNLLSGELDDLVDAFVTCVAPMDGSRGQGLANFLRQLPPAFNDLAYGTKTLPNGNKMADGILMGWVYKLKSIETETPLLSMWRDMMLLSKNNGDPTAINKTAAALNYWLLRDRNDLALNMTRVSFISFNTPIGKDGTLPVKLFGRSLNLKRLQERKIPWLICYGKQDDLVEPAVALAPTDYVKAEVTGFPKGHVAIATSWSHPESTYALHLRYPDENTRGPVRFQLDLQEAIDRGRKHQETRSDSDPSITNSAEMPIVVVGQRDIDVPALNVDKACPDTALDLPVIENERALVQSEASKPSALKAEQTPARESEKLIKDHAVQPAKKAVGGVPKKAKKASAGSKKAKFKKE